MSRQCLGGVGCNTRCAAQEEAAFHACTHLPGLTLQAGPKEVSPRAAQAPSVASQRQPPKGPQSRPGKRQLLAMQQREAASATTAAKASKKGQQAAPVIFVIQQHVAQPPSQGDAPAPPGVVHGTAVSVSQLLGADVLGALTQQLAAAEMEKRQQDEEEKAKRRKRTVSGWKLFFSRAGRGGGAQRTQDASLRWKELGDAGRAEWDAAARLVAEGAPATEGGVETEPALEGEGDGEQVAEGAHRGEPPVEGAE